MNQKRGLNRFSKLPDDGEAPNNLLKYGAIEKHQLDPGGPRNLLTESFFSQLGFLEWESFADCAFS